MADEKLKKKYKERTEAERERDEMIRTFAWELMDVEGGIRMCDELVEATPESASANRDRYSYEIERGLIYKMARKIGGKSFLAQVLEEKDRLERAVADPKLGEEDKKRKVISFDRRTLNRNGRDGLMRPPIFIDTHVGTIAAKNVKILFDIDTALDNVVEVAEIVYDPNNPLDTGATVRLITSAPLIVDGEEIE